MRFKKLVQYGIPGSGSTLVWQILVYICRQKTKVENENPKKIVRKRHRFKRYFYRTGVVVTYRDFRDWLANRMRKRRIEITKENINNLYEDIFKNDFYQSLLKCRDTYAGRRKKYILWLRYEDFVGNLDYIITSLEDFLQITINTNFSLEHNKAISDRLKTFDNKCDDSLIHGNHIGTGRPNSWKDFFPEQLHSYITNLMYDELSEWNYIPK